MRKGPSADGVGDRPGYGDEVFAFEHPSQLKRLRALAAVCDPATKAVLSEWAIRPGARCLEVGSGAGTVARWLAWRCPEGEVTATDTDVRFLAGLRHPGVVVLRHDVRTEEFPPGTFDLIVARSVLCHLRERHSVLARMVSWLAPGDGSMSKTLLLPCRVLRRPGRTAAGRRDHRDSRRDTRKRRGDVGAIVSGPTARPGPRRGGVRVHCSALTSGNAAGTAWRLSVADLMPVMDQRGFSRRPKLPPPWRTWSGPGSSMWHTR